ncbi:DsbA family oxidoreductase [Pedobacter miscanthi]|uniref:DsbA family oxidoreductase n=1 Tax=Pedobacter miscanthi TaxID=2259170 RepID=A0A366KZT4_9SPHI|nr:DsbA family oxidoreductase [Pedobacter miscanthi]RBQ06753.1 DsbA family oxidoreductase [Pedobacter miscanthi]
MKIEIWSDVACPYCYVASVRLARALERFKHKESIEILIRSFELEPGISKDSGETQHQAVMRKYRQTASGAQQTLDMAASAARESGIVINWDQVVTTNSFDAHRLIHFAGRFGKTQEMKKRLFEAYFTDGINISEPESLIALGTELGLDCRAVIEDNIFSEAIRSDEQEAIRLGITSVPFMLVERKFAVRGARMEDEFLDLLEEFYQEAIRCEIIEKPQEPGCGDGSCSV